MIEEYLTFSMLCDRWKMSEYTIAKLVIDGKLRSYDVDYMEICVIDNGYYIDTPEGHGTVISRPLTVAEVVEFIFRESDVDAFEKKHEIGPNALLTDLPQKGLTENPVAAHAQDKMDKVKITPPHTPEPANFFTKTGAYWKVSYKGEKKTIPGLDGIHYIAILLKEPEKSFSCRDLYQAVPRIASDKIVSKGSPIGEGLHADQKKQAVNTPKTKAKYLSRYKELEGDLERINDLMLDERSPEDELEKKEIEDEMAAINSYLKEKNFVDPNDKKAQVNITKRLQSAYKAIGKADMKELVKHLQTHIKPDGAFGLCYTGSITWEITIK